MTRRRALIGFTEAELGFVIAAVVAFTAAAEMRAEKPLVSVAPVAPETVFVERRVPATAPAPSAAADSQPEKSRPPWASNVFRRGCAEVEGKALARVPVGVIDVEGIDRYRVSDRPYSRRQLEEMLAPYDEESRQNMCRYTLLFRPARDVSASELLRAEEPFTGRFYREHRLH